MRNQQIKEKMNHVKRFKSVMNFQPVDRLPRIEWAMWWTKTIDRWKNEGLPGSFEGAHHILRTEGVAEIAEYLRLDPYCQFWINPLIEPSQVNKDGSVSKEIKLLHEHIKKPDDYHALRPKIFPAYNSIMKSLEIWGQRQKNGQCVVWITLEGFFWFPRTLFGIEQHLYAFYDHVELMHQMNQDLANHYTSILRKIQKVCVPTFITFAEDMSYNHGPMISKELFDGFMAPYYKQVIPVLEEMCTMPFVDSDGDITTMVPWFKEIGIIRCSSFRETGWNRYKQHSPQVRRFPYNRTF